MSGQAWGSAHEGRSRLPGRKIHHGRGLDLGSPAPPGGRARTISATKAVEITDVADQRDGQRRHVEAKHLGAEEEQHQGHEKRHPPDDLDIEDARRALMR